MSNAVATITQVDDGNIAELREADRAALILTKSDCGACAAYDKEIRDLIGQGQIQGVAIGKMVLDKPGSAQFKKESPWLREVSELPYTLLLRRGEIVDRFAASKGSYLAERMSKKLG